MSSIIPALPAKIREVKSLAPDCRPRFTKGNMRLAITCGERAFSTTLTSAQVQQGQWTILDFFFFF